ncbi:unnamed protein product [Chrysoparadoxa australica]
MRVVMRRAARRRPWPGSSRSGCAPPTPLSRRSSNHRILLSCHTSGPRPAQHRAFHGCTVVLADQNFDEETNAAAETGPVSFFTIDVPAWASEDKVRELCKEQGWEVDSIELRRMWRPPQGSAGPNVTRQYKITESYEGVDPYDDYDVMYDGQGEICPPDLHAHEFEEDEPAAEGEGDSDDEEYDSDEEEDSDDEDSDDEESSDSDDEYDSDEDYLLDDYLEDGSDDELEDLREWAEGEKQASGQAGEAADAFFEKKLLESSKGLDELMIGVKNEKEERKKRKMAWKAKLRAVREGKSEEEWQASLDRLQLQLLNPKQELGNSKVEELTQLWLKERLGQGQKKGASSGQFAAPALMDYEDADANGEEEEPPRFWKQAVIVFKGKNTAAKVYRKWRAQHEKAKEVLLYAGKVMVHVDPPSKKLPPAPRLFPSERFQPMGSTPYDDVDSRSFEEAFDRVMAGENDINAILAEMKLGPVDQKVDDAWSEFERRAQFLGTKEPYLGHISDKLALDWGIAPLPPKSTAVQRRNERKRKTRKQLRELEDIEMEIETMQFEERQAAERVGREEQWLHGPQVTEEAKKRLQKLRESQTESILTGNWTETVIAIDRVSHTLKGGRAGGYRALVITGNGNGVAGYGIGKSKEAMEATTAASKAAKRNLFYIERYKSCALNQDLFGRHNNCTVHFWKRPIGRGLAGSALMMDICEMAGIQHASVRVRGRRNPYAMVRAAFNALRSHQSLQDIAMARGVRILTLMRTIKNDYN